MSFFKYALRGVVWWGSYLLLAEGDLVALLDVVTCGRLGLWAARHPTDRAEREEKELGATGAEGGAGGDSGGGSGGHDGEGEAGGTVSLASSQVVLEGFDVIPAPGPSARPPGNSRYPPVCPTIPHAPLSAYTLTSPLPFLFASKNGRAKAKENYKERGWAVRTDEHDEGEESLLELIFPAKSTWRVVDDKSCRASATAEASACIDVVSEEAVAAEGTDQSTVPEVERETTVSWFAAP